MREECCNIVVAFFSKVQTFPSSLSLAFFPHVCFKLSFYVTMSFFVSIPSLMFVSFKKLILFLWVFMSRSKKPKMFCLSICECVPFRCHCLRFVCLSRKTMSTPLPTLYDLVQWQQGSQLILVHQSYFLHTRFNHWIGTLVLDCLARKCLFSYFTKKTITSIGIEVEIGVIPSILPKPSATLRKPQHQKLLPVWWVAIPMRLPNPPPFYHLHSIPHFHAYQIWMQIRDGFVFCLVRTNITKWGIIRQ
jgi:hypothetical protein